MWRVFTVQALKCVIKFTRRWSGMSLFKSAFVVGFFTLVSRVVGYIRDMMVASVLGTGFLADAFFVAFRLPNFFRTLSAEGAFTAAFVPLFSGKLTSEGKEKALNFAEHAFSFMFMVLLGFTIIMQIFMPFVMHILAPGFKDNPEQFETTVYFGRIMFPYLLLISMVSLFNGIMNSIGKFAAAAATPILLNLCTICSLLWLVKYTETPAHAVAWGVPIAGVLQLVWIVWAAKRAGIRLKPRVPELDQSVKSLLRRMVPGIIGGGVTQINLWINTVLATTISGAVSYLYYADRLVQFPLAIIGTAMGTALLPALSKQIKEHKIEDAIQTQNAGLEMVLLFTVPAAAALAVISDVIISVMFERGSFTAADTVATAHALTAYSLGLPAFVLAKVFAPVFFANGDTKTPVKIAFACLIANVAISMSLIPFLGHVGLAIATSSSSWLNIILLCAVLVKRKLYRLDKVFLNKQKNIVISAAIMSLAILYAKSALTAYLTGKLVMQVAALGFVVGLGMFVFFAAAHLTGGYKLTEVKNILLKRKIK